MVVFVENYVFSLLTVIRFLRIMAAFFYYWVSHGNTVVEGTSLCSLFVGGTRWHLLSSVPFKDGRDSLFGQKRSGFAYHATGAYVWRNDGIWIWYVPSVACGMTLMSTHGNAKLGQAASPRGEQLLPLFAGINSFF